MNKKGLRIIVILVLQCFVVSAQTFTKNICTGEDEFANTAIETPSGGYLLYLVKGTYTNDQGRRAHRDIILKIDSIGNDIDSIVFHDEVSSNFMITGLLKQDNDFLILGANFKEGDLNIQVSYRIMRYNYNLNLLHDTTFAKKDCYTFTGNIVLNSKGNIVIPGTYVSYDQTQINSFCKEMSIDGDSIKEHVFEGLQPYSNIIELPGVPCYNINNYRQIVQLDTNFNFIQVLYTVPNQIYPNTMVYLYSTKAVNDSTCIIEGLTSDWTFDAAWGLFNNGNWEKVMHFGSIDTNDYSMGMDFISIDNIYSSISQIPDTPQEFVLKDNQMMLYNTSINGTIKWIKRYGNNGYIRSGKCLATSDGGCLWLGNYWDWHHKTNHDYDIKILKINPDGSFFENVSKPIPQINTVVVYPNPGHYFVIKSVINADKVRLFNTLGQLVTEQKLSLGVTHINTSYLPVGIYFYQIFTSYNLVDCGEWIKIK